jgi:hypothetical protein
MLWPFGSYKKKKITTVNAIYGDEDLKQEKVKELDKQIKL